MENNNKKQLAQMTLPAIGSEWWGLYCKNIRNGKGYSRLNKKEVFVRKCTIYSVSVDENEIWCEAGIYFDETENYSEVAAYTYEKLVVGKTLFSKKSDAIHVAEYFNHNGGIHSTYLGTKGTLIQSANDYKKGNGADTAQQHADKIKCLTDTSLDNVNYTYNPIFILGYDLLHDFIASKPCECDIAFEFCKKIYDIFKTSEYNDINQAEYECLNRFIESLSYNDLDKLYWTDWSTL